VFTEATGIYSATNLGGYGSPNEASSFFTGELSVFKKTDSTNPIATYTIIPDGLGTEVILTPLPDGIYRFVYRITATDSSVLYQNSSFMYFYCDIKECLMNCITKDIDDESNIVMLQMFNMFLWELEYCGNYESAEKHRLRLKELCDMASKKCNC